MDIPRKAEDRFDQPLLAYFKERFDEMQQQITMVQKETSQILQILQMNPSPIK